MQQNIKCKWLHRSFVFLLSILVATSFMVPGSFGAFGAQEAKAADGDPVLIPSGELKIDENGIITAYNKGADTLPSKIIIPKEVVKDNVPIEVKGIGNDGVFANANLTSVSFEKGTKIESIGEMAFGNNNITHLELPPSLKTIGYRAFFYAGNLGRFDMSSATMLERIGTHAFAGTKISRITLPDTGHLKELGSGVFMSCDLGGSVKIPDSVTKMEQTTFYDFSGTVDVSAHEPNSLRGAPWTTDSGYAYVTWSDKYDINNANNPMYAEDPSLASNANVDTPFRFDTKQGIIYGLKSDLATKDHDGWTKPVTDSNGVTTGGVLTIPAKIGTFEVKGFSDGAFGGAGMRNQVRKIVFAADSKIDELPFAWAKHNTKLEEVTIPDSITSVGAYAFRFCQALKSFTAKNVTTIGSAAFRTGGGTDNIALKSVRLESSNVTKIDSSAFQSNVGFTEIQLPQMDKDTVKGAPWGADYATVYWKSGSGDPSLSPVITDEEGEWKFNPKTGTIYAYVKGDSGPEKDLDIPTQLKAGNETYTITRLGGNNASILGGQNLPGEKIAFRNVTIPKGIKTIFGAFRNVKLGSVDFSKSDVTEIAESSFQNSKLAEITLPDSLVKIGPNAFSSNAFTGTMRIPGNVTGGIGSSAFVSCPGITGIDVRMYAHKASDGVYDEDNFKYKNIGSTQAYAPWGASNAGRNIVYRDNPLPDPKATVVSNALTDPTNNTATIKVEAKTTYSFTIVKDFNVDGLNGMPALSDKEFISDSSDPMTTPAKVNMVIDSKSKKDSSNNTIQGGNGTYSLNIVYGGKGQENDRKTLLFTPRADIFRTLTYDANAGGKPISGAAPTAGDVYVEGYGVTLADKGAMNIKGYKFAGWNTKADGKGTNYSAGATFTMPKTNTTLYAKWDMNNVKTTFNANGGKFSDNNTSKPKTAQEGTLLSAALGTDVPTRAGYRLAGWASTNNATKPNETEVGASAKTVYAVWDANDVRVTYNANGGEVGGEPSAVRDGKVGATIPNIPTASNTKRIGYTFDGWYTQKTGGTKVTATTFPNANAEYYAHWNANKNTVKFAADPEGKTSQKDVTVLSGQPVGVTPTAQPNDDTEYRFLGQWRCDADKNIYTSEQIKDYVVDGSKSTVTFTAQFSKINKGIVTYDYKGGVDKDGEHYKSFEGETDKAFIPDSEVPTPELTGYTLSWSRAKPSVYPSGLITINAVWTPKENAVTFVVPNGTADPEGKTVKSGRPVGVSPKAEVDLGYKFNGQWVNSVDNKNYSADQIADYKISGEHPEITFTAQVSERPDWFALDAAIREGESKIAGEEKDKYTETSVQALEQALEAAKVVLNDPASSDGQLQAEKAAVDAAVKALKTKEQQQADDALAKAKSDAKAELDAVNVNLYEEPELSVVKKAIEDGKKEIDAATTIPQVDAAKKKALDIIAAQKTAAQKADEKKKTEDPKNIPTEVTDKTPANLVAVTTAITTAKNDGDLKGSTYAPLKFQSKKQTKKSIKLQWSKVKGAKQYTVYANQCGTKNKYKKLATVKGKTLNVKKVAGKKLKKGANYKFLIIAENGDKVSAISKTLHIRTAGHKKYTNYKSVSVKNTVIKKAKKLKKGKTLKLNAKGVVPKGKKVSVHVKTRYESANKKVATVTKAGKVKGVKKGKAKIYCYVQNGLAKVVTVTVK